MLGNRTRKPGANARYELAARRLFTELRSRFMTLSPREMKVAGGALFRECAIVKPGVGIANDEQVCSDDRWAGGSGPMLKPDRVAEYRSRAAETREQARIESDPAAQRRLLETAELWERMARYEESNGEAPRRE
jgi:hypothetical protein